MLLLCFASVLGPCVHFAHTQTLMSQGFSRGAWWMSNFAARAPQLFSAVALVATYTDPGCKEASSQIEDAKRLARVKVLVCQSSIDECCLIDDYRPFLQQIASQPESHVIEAAGCGQLGL